MPCLCKVAPSGSYHVEDVHRAGGIPAILGELDRAGLLNEGVHTVHCRLAADVPRRLGHPLRAVAPEARRAVPRGPGRGPHHQAVSQSERWAALDTDAADGCIRDVEHAYSADGGLAVLYGNLPPRGAS